MTDENERSFYCIVCPLGCRLSVKTHQDGTVAEISGNECPRGVEYAESEVENPVRILTTTVRASDGITMIPVRSSKPVPLALLRECVLAVNLASPVLPVRIGTPVVKNVCGTGADIVASASATATTTTSASENSSSPA